MERKSNNRIKPADQELKEKVVNLNRVAKLTKGGRTFSFAAIVVVGDGKGTVGHGLGKARDVSESIAKAVDDAVIATSKNLSDLLYHPIGIGEFFHRRTDAFEHRTIEVGKWCAGAQLNVSSARDRTTAATKECDR